MQRYLDLMVEGPEALLRFTIYVINELSLVNERLY
jgi:hypothetical protein